MATFENRSRFTVAVTRRPELTRTFPFNHEQRARAYLEELRRAGYGIGTRRACRCVPLHRSVYYYRGCKDPLTALRQRVRELAHARVRFGYCRIFLLLRREGWDVGKDRLYRVYREEGLGLRRKRPWRHVTAVHRGDSNSGASAERCLEYGFRPRSAC